MARQTWVTRRRWKVAAAGTMTVVACGAAASLLQSMFPNEVAGVIVKPGDQLGDALGWWKWLLAIPVVGTMLATSAATTFFIIGALMVGLPVARFASPQLHDRLLAGFDYDVLARIGSSQMDPDSAGSAVRLPWMLGSDGPRREAWDRLLSWCRGADRAVGDLSIVVLVGRSGSGKTRMSAELGRELARRDRLGGRRPVAGLRERLGYHMRSTSRRLGRPDDPWDAGALRRAGGQSREAFIAALLAWRPRRPSLLILDDPSSDIAEAVISAMEEGAASFRHPVRLLVASQTVPQGSRFAFSARDRRWLFDGAPADPPPVALPEEAWFDEATTRRAVFATRLLDGRSTAVQRIARERIHQVSEGNPLLVELALEWLVERGDLDDVTPEILSARRAARIVDAMCAAGVGDRSQIGAMALATLVGGAGRKNLEAEVASIFSGVRELPPAHRLRACFPADPLQERDGQAWIPPVRPRLIADAFVEAVVGEELDEADILPLLRAACRLDPRSFLARMAEVHLAGQRVRSGLEQLRPDDLATGDPVAVALAGAELAVVVPAELVRAKVAKSTSPIQSLVHSLIELCEPTLLLTNLDAFVELAEVYPMVAWIRGDAYADVVGRVLRRCAERSDGTLTAVHYSILVQQLARWTRLLNRWGTRDGIRRTVRGWKPCLRSRSSSAAAATICGLATRSAGPRTTSSRYS